jgi:hypothetical protein
LIELDSSGDKNSNEVNKDTLSSTIKEELRKKMELTKLAILSLKRLKSFQKFS